MGMLDYVGNAIFGGTPYQADAEAYLKQLQAQMAGGGAPSSAMQAHNQGYGKAIAGQQSMLASARPGYEGMAQRQAAQNVGALQAQQAASGGQLALQEQEEARKRYQEYLLALRQQQMSVPSPADKLMGAASGAAQALASDRRLKTDIEDGADEADEFLDAIRPYTFRYRDGAKHGEGVRGGVMAQDLERTRAAKHAIIDTPDGKMIDTVRLSGVITAALGRLGERVKAMETQRKAGA